MLFMLVVDSFVDNSVVDNSFVEKSLVNKSLVKNSICRAELYDYPEMFSSEQSRNK